ncbi:hypothetical protein [uncultured Methanobrevibacter sp.]|uniref:hypothetical protein n=1 Tax=uncultured Methanobrevibacter sp. TaxID=253161 RepID=UPI00261E90FE|nr:hypothetical protein [uncultured Methanobrevibacter sp.]
MTSQGMIFTKRNVIFVSDKQETMSDGKTYGGSNKIFELSRIHSAGMMVNGDADFENVPRETLIREFKIQTNFRRFSTIEEIKKEFIKFLSRNTESSLGKNFIKNLIRPFKESLISDFSEDLKTLLKINIEKNCILSLKNILIWIMNFMISFQMAKIRKNIIK